MKIPDDPFIKELLPEFVDSWINDISNQYPALIESKNSNDLYRLAHTLKGSCFQFGLDEVAQMGIELMDMAKSEQWDKASKLKVKIEEAFVDVKKFLESN